MVVYICYVSQVIFKQLERSNFIVKLSKAFMGWVGCIIFEQRSCWIVFFISNCGFLVCYVCSKFQVRCDIVVYLCIVSYFCMLFLIVVLFNDGDWVEVVK